MAHADYDCCAMCDCKMSYGGSQTKESFCSDCTENIVKAGGTCKSTELFFEWLKQQENKSELLSTLGYSSCYYDNDFDSEIGKLLDCSSDSRKEKE